MYLRESGYCGYHGYHASDFPQNPICHANVRSHSCPIFLCQTWFSGFNAPGPQFRGNSRVRAARSPTNRSQRFDTPSPGAHTCRAGHMSVVTISAHAHASTHSDEALRQTSSSETQQQAAARAQRHTNRTGISATCHPLLVPTHKCLRIAHVWHVWALRRPSQGTASPGNTRQRSPKFAQIQPGQAVLNLPDH